MRKIDWLPPKLLAHIINQKNISAPLVQPGLSASIHQNSTKRKVWMVISWEKIGTGGNAREMEEQEL